MNMLSSAIERSIDGICKGLNDGIIEHDRLSVFPKEKWEDLSNLGLFGLFADLSLGGSGIGTKDAIKVLEYLGFRCEDGGLLFSAITQLVAVQIPLIKYGTQIQKIEFLPTLVSGQQIGAHCISEPGSGSDAFAMKTSAVIDGDDFVLNGSKTFVTNGPIANIFVVYAVTNPEKPAFGRMSAFLVKKEDLGFSVGSPIEKMGLRTSPFSEVFFNDCRLPADRVIGRVGRGLGIMDTAINFEIICIAAVQVGEIKRLLNRVVLYSKERKQFGEAIGQFQSISHKIADIKIKLELASTYLDKIIASLNEGAVSKISISVAKTFISEAYEQTARDAIQIFGGSGYTTAIGIEKSLRDAVAASIYSGTNQIHRNIIYSLL